jgi:NAD(P)-dependent dehydrogenase (short-subunit alcohol dehydrogenase family)
MQLKDKTAIVTGAAGNIGAATVQAFLAEGARVMAVDRNAESLARLAASHGNRLTILGADVTSAEDSRRIADTALERLGRVDIAFANAGVEGVVRHVPDYPDDVYDRVMDVNVKGVFLGLKHIVPRMADGGSFIITSSVMGLKGQPFTSAYSASKHAVVGLMRSAAIDFAPRRLRVNCVHPGLVESEMLERLYNDHENPAEKRASAIASIKLGRFLEPMDIARAVVFLAGDDSTMITGQSLTVDGGQLL